MAAVANVDPSQQQRHREWYDPDIEVAPSAIRTLLETYSKVPPENVVAHINKIREISFAVNPYPCIGRYKFLNLTLLGHPEYEDIVRRLRSDSSAKYLDFGCCFGQDLRQLAADGVPSTQLIGLDLEGPLMDIGYDLFLDRDTLQSKFLVLDAFKGAEQPEWQALEDEKVDVLHCSAFFHLFPLPTQIELAKKVSMLVRPGGVIVGRQMGSIRPAEVPAVQAGATSFRHDTASFKNLWDQVGSQTGTKWSVESSLDMVGVVVTKDPTMNEDSRRLLFTIRRIE